MDIICVVLGADTKKIRTTDSVKLIEYSFSNFKNIDINKKVEEKFESWKNINEGRIIIEKGVNNGIKLKLDEYNLKNYPIENGTEERIIIKVECNMKLVAPIDENSVIGKLIVLYNENVISQISVLTAESVKKKGVLDYIFEIYKDYSDYLERAIK